MDEIEKLKERLNKAAEIFKTMKAELDEKNALIECIQNENKVLREQLRNTESANTDSVQKIDNVYSAIKSMNKQLENDFNIFD